MTAGGASSLRLGPLELVEHPPSGWTLEGRGDALYEPFARRTMDGDTPGEGDRRSDRQPVRLPIELQVHGDPDPVAFRPVLETTSWALERSAEGILRWTLPDPAGSFLWRATLHQQRTRIEVGARLVLDHQRIANPLRYPLDQLIASRVLPELGGFVVHSAGFRLGERALFAAGVSGAGKTTLSRIVRAAVPEVEGLSDDRIIAARSEESGWTAWGSPWAGEGRVASGGSAPLAAVLVLDHSNDERLVRLSPRDALARLLPSVAISWYDPEVADLGLALLERLVTEVPCYSLEFRPVPRAAELVLDLLGG